jgi:hypothetical protein
MGEITKELFQDVPEIEFHIGYQYFLGNMGNYTNGLLSVLKSIKSKLSLLQMMCMTDEYEGLRTITQTLRKLLVNVGATSITESTYQLETASLNEDNATLHNQVVEYMDALMDFSERLETLIKNIELNRAAIQREEVEMRRFDYIKSLNRIMQSSEEDRRII